MASKKILLGVGLLAAMAIVFYAVIGWPPVPKEDTSGAIGVAKKYQAEQISDQDVALTDPDIQALLQTDFFYQLVTDADFQKLYLNGVLGKAVTQVPASLGGHNVAQLTELGKALSNDQITQNIAAGKYDVAAQIAKTQGISVTADQLASFATQSLGGHQVGSQNLGGHQVGSQPLGGHSVASLTDLGKALSNDQITQNIAAGKYDVAAQIAKTQGISVTADQLAGYGFQTLGGHGVASLTDLGKALTNDQINQNMAVGKFDIAAGIAKTQGLNVTPDQLAAYSMQNLGAKSVEDVAALGRLMQKEAFGKVLPQAGTLQKLLTQSAAFNTAVKSGDLGKFSTEMAKKGANK
jgi:hypothetical protein